MTGAIEKTLEDNKAKFDHLVDNEKTADVTNVFLCTRVTSAGQPLLARRLKDEEEWLIRSRAQVTELPKRRRDERELAKKKKERDHQGGEPRAKAEDERQTD